MRAVTSNPRHTPVNIVRKWCIALGVLTAGNMTKAEADMRLRAYVPVLQDQFPVGAFTQASLAAVAKQCKWFPSYAEVAMHLSAYWREHRPLPPLLPPPPPIRARDEPTPEEIEHVSRIVRETVAALRSSEASRAPPLAPMGPRHLSPAQLDQINPLPGGRKRDDAQDAAASTTG